MSVISCFRETCRLDRLRINAAIGLSFLAVCVFGNAINAFDGLPSAAELIREAESACASYEVAYGEANAGCLIKIADAKAWQGDTDGALQIVLNDGETLSEIAAISCVEIHLTRTGEIRRLPESVFEEMDGRRLGYSFYRFEFAKKLYGFDRKAEALAFLPTDDSTLLSTLFLIEFHIYAGEHDLQAKRGVDAQRHFSEAIVLLNRSPERRYSRDAEMFFRAARGLIGVGDHSEAEQCLIGLSQKLKVSLLPEKLEKLKDGSVPGLEYLAKDCARLGGIYAVLGDRARADHEFKFAQSLLTLPETTEADREQNDYEIDHRLKTAIEIAVWQCESGFTSEGAAVIEQTVDRSSAFENSLVRQALLKRAVDALCETGHRASAASVAQSLNDGYWKCAALCVIARAEFRNGESESAKVRLQAACELCSKVRNLDSRSSMWIEIAEAQTEMSDRTKARSSYLKALSVLDETVPEDYHVSVSQSVCRSQIRMRYLEDAYRTLKLLRDPDARCLPLAELALAASKADQ
jgi:hypothetical protein